jgi:hypothetical protein
MSWDISIMDLPRDAPTVAEIPDDFQPGHLGDRAELIRKIQSVAPAADFSDPSWGEVVTPEFVIEFNMGQSEVVDSIMLHVRGGDTAVGLVADLLARLDLRAIDCSEGDFFDESAAVDSLAAWRAYRDRVVQGD